MHWLYIILIALSLALGIFASVMQSGANLVRIDRKVILVGFVSGLLDLGAAAAGFGISHLAVTRVDTQGSGVWIRIIAGAILALIGIRMLVRAFGHHSFLEHRMESLDLRSELLTELRLCVHSFFAGLAMGLLQISLLPFLFTVMVMAIAFAIGGYFAGRSLGPESSTPAFAVGGGLLCLVGVILQLIR